MKNVPRPRVPEGAPIQPFKKEEVELLIKACDHCEEAVTDRRRKFTMQRSTGKRDKAILLTLLDTGLRASELCALRIEDVDMKSGKVQVKPAKQRMGKGRIVWLPAIETIKKGAPSMSKTEPELPWQSASIAGRSVGGTLWQSDRYTQKSEHQKPSIELKKDVVFNLINDGAVTRYAQLSQSHRKGRCN